MSTDTDTRGGLPLASGIGLRGPHHADILAQQPAVAWLEAHSENYFALDGIPCQTLTRVREHYPISLHGVGLSLGSTDPLSQAHLRKLDELARRIEPAQISEHLSWGSVNGSYLNDLLPMPYTEEAVEHMAQRVNQTQCYLRRNILIENVSGYVEFECSEMTEWEFLVEVAQRAGAGILLDVNNIFVNARNHGFAAEDYIRHIPRELVGEIHLAGHSTQTYDDYDILVDTHDAHVCADVWSLYRFALEQIGPKPTLIEWDSKLPPVATLVDEARRAQTMMDEVDELAA